MDIEIPLDRMSTSDKLRALEQLERSCSALQEKFLLRPGTRMSCGKGKKNIKRDHPDSQTDRKQKREFEVN